MTKPEPPIWHDEENKILSCTEKVKVMTENIDEVWQLLQDTFEDAILMGCDEGQIRDYLALLATSLENPYKK